MNNNERDPQNSDHFFLWERWENEQREEDRKMAKIYIAILYAICIGLTIYMSL